MERDQLHIPQRLEDETRDQYHGRLRISALVAQQTKLIHSSGGGRGKNGQKLRFSQRFAAPAKRARRALVKDVGIRQAKRMLRQSKVEMLAKLAA